MEQCPANSGCYRGVCCPLVCPSGQDATGFCDQTGSVTVSCSQQVKHLVLKFHHTVSFMNVIYRYNFQFFN